MLSPSLDPYLDACLYDSSPGDDLIKDGRIDKENGAKRKIDLENEGKDSCNEEQDSGIPPNPSKKPRVTFDLPSPPGLDFAEGSLDSIHEAVVPDWDQPGPSGERSPPTPPSVMGPGGDTIGTIDESNKENIPPPSVTSTPPSTVDDQPHLAATTEEEDDETALPATLELDSPTWQNLSEQDEPSSEPSSSSTDREQEVIYYYTSTSDEDVTNASPVVFRSRRKRSRARRSLSFPPVLPEEYQVVPSWWDPED